MLFQCDYTRGQEDFTKALNAAGYNIQKGTMDDLFEAMTFTQLHLLVNEGGMFLEQVHSALRGF